MLVGLLVGLSVPGWVAGGSRVGRGLVSLGGDFFEVRLTKRGGHGSLDLDEI